MPYKRDIDDKVLIKRFLARIRRGNGIKAAAGMCGLAFSQIHIWLKKGKNMDMSWGKNHPDYPYRDFFIRFHRARGRFEDECLKQLLDDKAWQTRAWVLERINSKRWGRKLQLPAQPPAEVAPKSLAEIVGDIRQVQAQALQRAASIAAMNGSNGVSNGDLNGDDTADGDDDLPVD